MTLLTRRILACLLDYAIILIYATLIFLIVTSIEPIESFLKTDDPIKGQFIGFLFLTLPVFFYFYLFEKNKNRATVGKRIFKISLKNIKGSIFKRNLIKFLPWEIAHLGVHWLLYSSKNSIATPYWIWICLIAPQLIVICYFISILTSKGTSSIYDTISKTKLELSQ